MTRLTLVTGAGFVFRRYATGYDRDEFLPTAHPGDLFGNQQLAILEREGKATGGIVLAIVAVVLGIIGLVTVQNAFDKLDRDARAVFAVMRSLSG